MEHRLGPLRPRSPTLLYRQDMKHVDNDVIRQPEKMAATSFSANDEGPKVFGFFELCGRLKVSTSKIMKT